MKTIGLIGGMSWESTATYYRLINEAVKRQLGGLHSARILLYSVDFFEIEECQARGDWEQGAMILADAAGRLERAGADFIVICTNTMHKVAPQIQQSIGIPLLHIAEATARELQRRGTKKVLLLGTKYTMTQDFYKEKLISAGIEVLIPDPAEIEQINSIIFDELCLGEVKDESRNVYLRIIEKHAKTQIQGVILGCTEIGLLVRPEDVSLPVFDTTEIHAAEAVRQSLNEEHRTGGGKSGDTD
jgi:aspartate racemase